MARQVSSSKSGKGTGSVSKHPLFPAMVALWFAALFGLGSLAVRPALIESLILATGVERAIPAVAPPVDMVTRAGIALSLAVAGGLLGLIVARMILVAASGHDSQPETFQQARRPFSAQELAEVSFDEPEAEPERPGEDETPAARATPARVPPTLVDLTALQRALLSEETVRPVLVPAAGPDGVTIDFPAAPERAHPAPLGKAAQRLLAANLATLTPVELVERLGLSMQLQRSAMPSSDAPMPAILREAPLPQAPAAPPARAGNEQVLRSALAALQRLSGAA